MSPRTLILQQIAEIAQIHDRPLPPLTDDLPLLDSGLDSLCIAILVANLEDELGLDPFSAPDVAMPVTIGDFISLYEHARV
jgi:acyl carrier protein